MRYGRSLLLAGLLACATTSGAPRPEFRYALTPECAQEDYGMSQRWHPCDLERAAKTLVERAVNGDTTDALFAPTSSRITLAPPINKTSQQIDGQPFASILERGVLESRRGVPASAPDRADVRAQVRFEEEPLADGARRYVVTLTLERIHGNESWSSSYAIVKEKRPPASPEATW